MIEKYYYAYAYMRISQSDEKKGKEDESNSITNQRALIQEYLKKHTDIRLVGEKIDDGITGTTFNRPAFQEMIQEIEKNQINCVIVKDLSRFGRNYIEAGGYLEYIFPKHNVRFIAINDNIDSITERNISDSIMLPFKNIMNDAYSSDISIKVRSQFEVKRRNGECVAAFVPFGYCKDKENKHRLMIDSYAATVVKDIFKWKLNGYSQKYIVEKLNNIGVPAPSDYKSFVNPNYRCNLQKNDKSSWTVASVNTILKNEVYLGILIQGKSTTPNVKVKKIMKLTPEQWVRVENTHEPIISEQDFLLVQKLLQLDIRAAPGENKIYPLSGYVYCGDCGQSMNRKVVTKKGVKYSYYVCGTYRNDKTACQSHLINTEKLENCVLKFLKYYIEMVTSIDYILEEMMNKNSIITNDKTRRQNKNLEKSLNRKKELQVLCDQLYEDILEGMITKEECKELEELYNKQIEHLSRTIAVIEESHNTDMELGCKNISVEGSVITQLTRAMVIRMIERIEVYTKSHIKVIYRFDNNLKGELIS